jgi:hypothetical protein
MRVGRIVPSRADCLGLSPTCVDPCLVDPVDCLIGSWDRWLSGSQSNTAQPREDLNVRDAGATAGRLY